MVKRLAIIAVLFALTAPMAHANPGPPFMAGYLISFALPAFFLWCVLGVILIATNRKLKFIGPIALALAFMAGMVGAVEVVLIFWRIYLCLIIARLVCQKRGRRDPDWLLNLIFHSTFLGALIVAGIHDIFNDWSDRWAGWHALMAKNFLGFFTVFCGFALIVFTFSSARQWGLRATEALNQRNVSG